MTDLLKLWIELKEAERVATEQRRDIEDKLTEHLCITDQEEWSKTINQGDYKIKVTCRMNRKIDGDKLQEIAKEAGLTDHLSTLFRWKPEIDAKNWKSTDSKITDVLAGAITTTPVRPSYSIEQTKGEE